MAHILLTGGSGFVGSYLLHRLISDDQYPFVLLRGENRELAAQRLERALRTFGTDTRYPRERIVLGDITQQSLGMRSSDLEKIRFACDRLIHCAALPKFAGVDRQTIHAVNVTGTLHVAELAVRLGIKRFFHFSTLYVCGHSGGTFTENDQFIGQRFRNTYEETKLLAECQLAELLKDTEVTLTVLRPGIVAGDSRTGAISPSSALGRFIAGYQQHQDHHHRQGRQLVLPYSPHSPINLIPIDYLADCFQAIMQTPERWGKTHHLQYPHSVTLGNLSRWIQNALNMDCVDLLPAQANSPAQIKSPLASLYRFYEPYLTSPPDIAAPQAEMVKYRQAIPCPEINEATIRRFVRFCMHCRTRKSNSATLAISHVTARSPERSLAL